MTTKHKGKSAEPQADPDPAGEAITLSPATAVSGDATDITLVVTGTAGLFDETSEIFFNGLVEPTTLIDPTRVSTGVKPSLFVVPAVCPVHVVTGDVATQAADFTFVEAPEPDTGVVPDEVLEAQLRSWGISGEPVSWAYDQWQPVIVAIRAANTGYGTVATVQGMLDFLFPVNDLDAAAICLDGSVAANAAIVVTDHDGKTRLSTAVSELHLASDNVTWLVDGVVVAHGADAEVPVFPPGTYTVDLQIAIAGVVYSHQREVVVEG